jgi:hypothetical protein
VPNFGRVLFVAKAHPGKRRMLSVHGGDIGDDRDVYDGERTILTLGVHDDGPAIMEAVTKAFGGYLQESSTVEEWRPVAPVATEFLPRDKLRIAMAKTVGAKEAGLLMKMLDDDDKREELLRLVGETWAEPTSRHTF